MTRLTTSPDADPPVVACHLATTSDRDLVSSLATEALRGLAGVRGGNQRSAEMRERLFADETPSSGARHLVGIGAMDGVPCALAVGDIAGDRLRIELVYVRAESRRAGLATALFTLLTTSAKRAGVHTVDVAVLPGDRALKSFLESQSFRARLLVMHRELP